MCGVSIFFFFAIYNSTRMSDCMDDDDFMVEDDEDFEFDYEDDEDEDGNAEEGGEVDLENRYYNAKGKKS